MAIKGDEPISAANLKNLADGGVLGGGVVLFEHPNASYNDNNGVYSANLTQSAYGFDRVDVYIFYKWFYVTIVSVPCKAMKMDDKIGSFSPDTSNAVTLEFSDGGRKLTLNSDSSRGAKFVKVVGYR